MRSRAQKKRRAGRAFRRGFDLDQPGLQGSLRQSAASPHLPPGHLSEPRDRTSENPLLRTPMNSSEEETARWLVMPAQSPPGATWVAPSVVQEPQIDQPEALRVGEYVDLGDLPARDREAHHREGRAARGPRDYPRHPVHQRPARELAKVREGSG